ncbi:hypothetical protein E1J38_010005 [Seonamhaeicola sediminis]|uniref:DUF5689 domain-containing protein n=1 Tax=Seonamhaeicola sediminis TaxID=2528206 RepID=A0A562YDF7_9FLAO|nr:DUF5689 domain-containing protein [Seonamhaeicola sediminis]TWO32151.1 hypothetical protein E1J38_010005 [Seonamhaeicola sediminis]
MNKVNRILTLLSVVAFVFVMVSCVQDDDYATPNLATNEPDVSENNITTFKAVVQRYVSAVDADEDGELDDNERGRDIGVFETDEAELYITGYIVSSDKAGNFFEELIIQNYTDDSNPDENPRLGFRVEVNVSSLYNTYEFGRKVYIKLNGLAIGESNGVLVLGKPDGTQVGQIQAYEFKDFIMRSSEVAEIKPKVTTISELTELDENTFIQLDDVQINRNELDKTFAGDVSDEFDGFRTLESCSDNSTLTLQTSTFADFKSLPVPQLRGSIKGIFSRDFRDDFSVLLINSRADIAFDNSERCDPIELSCGLASSQGSNNLFADDFETQSIGSLISGNGWTNYIESGTEGWEAYSSGGTNSSLGVSARVGSFRSGDASSVAWLISPAIDLDSQDNETLVYKTSNSFSDGSEMELLFSNDWDGTTEGINSATWGILADGYITQDSDFFGAWFDSGIIDLSCTAGTIYIAFKYTGSGEDDFDGTFELDDISIDY